MLSPINWIKPRLKSLCIAFGAADMTLVILSTIWWVFFFNVGFEAQHLHYLYDKQSSTGSLHHTEEEDDNFLYNMRDAQSVEDMRLERTIRACGLRVKNNHLDTESVDSNYAGPAALIGCSMGSFFTIGVLLTSLNVLEHPAARRVVCAVALFGESTACFFLFLAVSILSANDGLCPTEYYYEYFQPVLHLFVFTLIFLCTYKAYEITIIAFYWSDQHAEFTREKNTIKGLSGGGTGTLASDLKKLKLSQNKIQGNEKRGDKKSLERNKKASNMSMSKTSKGGK